MWRAYVRAYCMPWSAGWVRVADIELLYCSRGLLNRLWTSRSARVTIIHCLSGDLKVPGSITCCAP
jgi:hypothetical protein